MKCGGSFSRLVSMFCRPLDASPQVLIDESPVFFASGAYRQGSRLCLRHRLGCGACRSAVRPLGLGRDVSLWQRCSSLEAGPFLVSRCKTRVTRVISFPAAVAGGIGHSVCASACRKGGWRSLAEIKSLGKANGDAARRAFGVSPKIAGPLVR